MNLAHGQRKRHEEHSHSSAVVGDGLRAGCRCRFFPASRIARRVTGPTGIEPPPGMEESARPASPNPMRTVTNLQFQSIGCSPMILEAYDISGDLVRAQNLGTIPVGSHSHYWDGCDGSGSPLASGVCFVRISSAELEVSTRVVLIR